MPKFSNIRATILLATYQGERFLSAQLASIAGQSHGNWSLIVSDDGSTDQTAAIVEDFAAAHPQPVRWVAGPQRGATQNFLHLIHNAPDGVIAFCDQDDVWFSDKLARAVASLHNQNGPAHYAARTIICDQALNPLAGSRLFHRPLGFRNALVQACMAGNSSVFNAPAVALLKKALPAARDADILSHDWWAYQLMSGAGATLIYDPQPSLYYRQHERSEVGRNDTDKALLRRFRQLFARQYAGWLVANQRALHAARDLLTPESRDILDQFGELSDMPGMQALRRLRRLKIYRQTVAGTAALYAAAALGRLHRP